jgi:hypothetical protein
MTHPCCDDVDMECAANINCDLPRTGRCVDQPACPENHRFDIWEEVCVYVPMCAENEEYDWHAEGCVAYRNWCDQNEPEKMNLYHRCVNSCEVW